MGLLCATAGGTLAQTTIFVVRHADREGSEPDPPLTADGRKRAENLGSLLRDAHITHIFTTEFQRTEQTAGPVARRTHVEPEVIAQANLAELIETVRRESRPGEGALIVGHRGTVPKIVRALAGTSITPLGSGEYDRLLVLTLFPSGKANVVTLRYGTPDSVTESTTRRPL